MSLDIHISSQNIICLIYCKALSPKNNHFKELYLWKRRCPYKEIVLNTGHHFFCETRGVRASSVAVRIKYLLLRYCTACIGISQGLSSCAKARTEKVCLQRLLFELFVSV